MARYGLATGFAVSLALVNAGMLIGLMVHDSSRELRSDRVGEIALCVLGIVSLGCVCFALIALYLCIAASPIAEPADDSASEPDQRVANGRVDGAAPNLVADEGALAGAVAAHQLADARDDENVDTDDSDDAHFGGSHAPAIEAEREGEYERLEGRTEAQREDDREALEVERDAEYKRYLAAARLIGRRLYQEAAHALASVSEERLDPVFHEQFRRLRDHVGRAITALDRLPAGAYARHEPSGDSRADFRTLLRCALDEPGGPEVVIEVLDDVRDKAFDAILYGDALQRLGKVNEAAHAYFEAREKGAGWNELASRIATKRTTEMHSRENPDLQAMLDAMEKQKVSVWQTVHWNFETKVLTVVPDLEELLSGRPREPDEYDRMLAGLVPRTEPAEQDPAHLAAEDEHAPSSPGSRPPPDDSMWDTLHWNREHDVFTVIPQWLRGPAKVVDEALLAELGVPLPSPRPGTPQLRLVRDESAAANETEPEES